MVKDDARDRELRPDQRERSRDSAELFGQAPTERLAMLI
jgi:hypothetical protein